MRPHGLRGQVVVELWTNRTERLSAGSRLTTSSGVLQVKEATGHKGRWLVSFEGFCNVGHAEAVMGEILKAAPLDDPGCLWIHELIGADVVDVEGRGLGRVVSVEANPASDLMVLEGGGLVPLRFVEQVSEGRVVVDTPPGLLE